MPHLKYLLIALRPKQWIKNLFVFAALIFAGRLLDLQSLLLTLIAFLVFCSLASAVYLVNDWQDLQSDQNHPIKKHRPLASGRLSLRVALLTAGLLGIIGLMVAFAISAALGWVSLTYVLLSLFYSFFTKRVPVLDILSVAVGFVLRAIAGAKAILVIISPWLVVCTFFVALFLVLGKRRADAVNHGKTEIYNQEFLDQLLVMTAGITILAYVLYTMDPQTITKFGTTSLLYTTLFVVYGIFRYFYLVTNHRQGGSPTETLLTDLPILLSGSLWAISVGLIIYF